MTKLRPWEPILLFMLCAASSDEEMERTRQTASRPMHGVGVLHAVHYVIGMLYIVGQGYCPNSCASTSTLTAASIHWPLGCGRVDDRR